MPISALLRASKFSKASNRLALLHKNTRSLTTTVSKTGVSYTLGDQYGGFHVKRISEVSQLGLTAVELTHDHTRAKHLHLDRNDSNNVFSIGFKTNPPDYTGVPHILEHTTLCGSEKFPVRDPFFKMLTRSLANFMNAMTGFDFTFYPFATTNQIDYANLQQVYLDAVYKPLLRELDFSQEGWRLENEDPNDINSPLNFKGVVFNEMKGQMSNPSYLFYIKYFHQIYPSLNSSGGDPEFITDLKYQELKDFHDQKYHPSNSFTLSYGNIRLDKVLAPLESTISEFKYLDPQMELKKPIELTETKSVVVDGPLDPLFDETRQYKTSLSWILGDTSDVNNTYLWKVFSNLLMDGHSSPLYKALIDTNLGTDFSVNSGLDPSPGKNIFTVGLQGLNENDIPKFKAAVFEVLEDVAKNGIPQDRIDAVVNQAELADREVEANLGMGFVYKIFPRVFNETDAFNLLDNSKLLSNFKKEISQPGRFQQLAKDFLLSKPYLEFTMTPKSTFGSEIADREKAKLEKYVNALTEADKKQIYEQGQRLLETQSVQEDVSVLPTLVTEDISKEIKPIVVDSTTAVDVPVSVRVTDTQGLTYLRMQKNINNLPSALRPFLPLYSDAVINVGTRERSMDELENEIKLNTGGLAVSPSILSSPHDTKNVNLVQHFTSVSIDEKSKHLYSYYKDFLLNANFANLEKLIPLIQGSVANSMNSLSESGHSYATGHAAAAFSISRRLSESLNGIEQVQFMKQLSVLDEKALNNIVVSKLDEVAKHLATAGAIKVGLTLSPGNDNAENVLNQNKVNISEFTSSLPSANTDSSSLSDVELLKVEKTFFTLPFQVSYVGVALKGVEYTHKDGGALQILANLLTHKYLHKEIREKGGAYGGGASYSAMDGVFTFYSYRDPNPANSLSAIVQAGEWAVANEWTQRNLDEAKLSIFQGIDAPLSPRSEISSEFVHGITNELRQARRDALLSVTIEDIVRVAKEYLIPSLENDFGRASVTVLGPEQPGFEKEKGWNVNDIETPVVDFSASLTN
ncbi:hypothetical protein DS838_003566 [Geotrichum bryndzae]|nr:hypothetical protein DS838_003566 [Geotrichum bryndzae]